MSVRLNITMDSALYVQLKKSVPAKKLSAFINEAVKAKLTPNTQALDAAYRAASQETWRRDLADDWATTETDEWPK